MQTIAETLNLTLHEEMERDPAIIVLGEDVALFGGRVNVTKGLFKKFGGRRVIDTPINEELFIGFAIGAAQVGLRPVVEFCHSTFVTIDLNNIRRLGVWSWINAQKVHVPVVVRVKWGSDGLGHELSSSPLSTIVDHLGLTVVAPSTPRQAKGLLAHSLRGDVPVIFLEDGKIYHKKGPVPPGEYLYPFGVSEIRKPGSDITLIGYGHLTEFAEQTAFSLSDALIDAEVLDLVSLAPLDTETIVASAKKTGHALIFSEEPGMSGFSSKLIATILTAVPSCKTVVVAPPPVPLPFGSAGKSMYPSVADAVQAATTLISRS
jgi:pyruvate dehydrogenase E1 component beta subunit